MKNKVVFTVSALIEADNYEEAVECMTDASTVKIIENSLVGLFEKPKLITELTLIVKHEDF